MNTEQMIRRKGLGARVNSNAWREAGEGCGFMTKQVDVGS
jgi:hypothetical protein